MEDGNEWIELFDSFEGIMNIILYDQDFSYDTETDSYDSNFEATLELIPNNHINFVFGF